MDFNVNNKILILSALLTSMSLFSFLPPEIGNLCDIIAATLLVIISIKGLINWCNNRKPPNIDVSFIIEPLFPESNKKSRILTIPLGQHQIIYFKVSPQDSRKYEDPLVWVTFPKNFIIDFTVDYGVYSFGKKLDPLEKNVAKIVTERYLQKDSGNDYLVFPIVFKSPREKNEYEVNVELSSKTTRKPYKQTLKINITDDANKYSYEPKMFEPLQYKVV